MKIYLVGGAVRDQLLKIPVKEKDWLVVGATPQEMISQGYRQVGKDFPVFIHPESGEEYALSRTERKSGHGYKGFDFYSAPDVSVEQDLLRRDLTINAIAQDVESGQIIDPYHGQRDLEQRILRHVSGAFVEDPLRVLRVARFTAQLHSFDFKIAEETKQLMLKIVRDAEMQYLVAERVWQELEKSLATSAPEQFIKVLRDCGALAELFPELDRLFGVPNPAYWHPEVDTGVHTMMALQKAAELTEDKAIRFATLVHDFGKGLTPMSMWPSHIGHGERGLASIKDFCKRYPVPTQYSDLALLVSRVHIQCHKCEELSAIELLTILEQADVFRRPERFEKLLCACHADANGRTGHENDDYTQREFLKKVFEAAKKASVKNADLSGKEFGEALRLERLKAVEEFLSPS